MQQSGPLAYHLQDEHGDAVTFANPDPDTVTTPLAVGGSAEPRLRSSWLRTTPLPPSLDLPPLPILRPLSALRPMAPMPRAPFDRDPEISLRPVPTAAVRQPVAVTNLPQRAPASTQAVRAAAPWTAAAPAPQMEDRAPTRDEEVDTGTSDGAVPPEVPAAWPGPPAAATVLPAPVLPATLRPVTLLPASVLPVTVLPAPTTAGWPQAPTPGRPTPASPLPAPPSPAATAAGPGRHVAREPSGHEGLQSGRHTLIIGGAEPLGATLTGRLMRAGYRLAVHNVAHVGAGGSSPAGLTVPAARAAAADAPVVLHGDRVYADDVAQWVADAERALGGLGAVVILPGRPVRAATLDSDTTAWAESWSHALASEVLAAVCAAHAAARSFRAGHRAGRIILVTPGGSEPTAPSALPRNAIEAALAAAAAELARTFAPQGIAFSVVSTGPAANPDAAAVQAADLVETLLSAATPVSGAVHLG